ncbi:hypothetical protein GOBAR_AA15575 [Gossypium barbadense]|uniref:Uncharacterized protein n=1 Tax=Gossypium barbadense TaxID=3634 RepID=A0A2P5XP06_GOSBA|nr:hypothetical protein GOBAR_AA15575 [Gossypium barbadense]
MPICEAFAQIEQQLNICDVVMRNIQNSAVGDVRNVLHVYMYWLEPLKLDILISFQIMVFIWVWTLRLRVFHLLFLFQFPSQHTGFCHDREAELSLEFPDGTIPVTCCVSIYDGSAGENVGVGSLMDKASAPPLPAGSDKYFESNKFLCPCCQLGEELFFTDGGQHIPFGASPQDVWSELGRPCGIHQHAGFEEWLYRSSNTFPVLVNHRWICTSCWCQGTDGSGITKCKMPCFNERR